MALYLGSNKKDMISGLIKAVVLAKLGQNG